MGPVAEIVHGIVVFVDKIPASDVVNVAIPIIVDTVAGDLTCIDPDVGSQILVQVVDSGVDDADDHAG